VSQYLPCPVCQSQIPIDLHLLAKGASLVCPNSACGAMVGVASNSLATLSTAVTRYQNLEALRPATKGAT